MVSAIDSCSARPTHTVFRTYEQSPVPKPASRIAKQHLPPAPPPYYKHYVSVNCSVFPIYSSMDSNYVLDVAAETFPQSEKKVDKAE